MGTFLHSISAVTVVLLLTATGYLLGRLGYIREEHKQMLTRLVVNIGLPSMTLSNLTQNFTRASLVDFGRLLLVPLFSLMAGFVLSTAAAYALRIRHNRRGVFIAMGAFTNSTFIGMPMCVELFGEAAVPYVLCFYLANTVLFQTLGVAFIERSGQPVEFRESPLKRLIGLLKKPPLIAIVLSLALIWFDIPLPGLIQSYTRYLGNMVSPLGLIYAGLVIYEYGLKNLRLERDLVAMLGLRFVASPALCLLFCILLGAKGLSRGVFLVESALPTMTQTVVLSSMLGADEDFAAMGAALSTIACFGVVPIIMLLL